MIKRKIISFLHSPLRLFILFLPLGFLSSLWVKCYRMTQYRSRAFSLTRKYMKVCISNAEWNINSNSDIKLVFFRADKLYVGNELK